MFDDKIVQVVLNLTRKYGRLQTTLMLLLGSVLGAAAIILIFVLLLWKNVTPSEVLLAMVAPLTFVVTAVIVLMSLIQMIHEREEKLKTLIASDPLTGTFNRQAFLELGHKEFDRTQRHNYPLSTLVVDINKLQGVNDRHGYGAGDDVIRCLVMALKDSVRSSDTIARSGDDEFAVLLTEAAGEGPQVVAERLRKNFANHLTKLNQQIESSLSIGISARSEDTESFEVLLEAAREGVTRDKQRQPVLS